MLNKFTFEKKLGIDSTARKWLGLKIATVSFLVTAFGALLHYFQFIELGRFVVVCGFIGGFVGILLHITAMFGAFKEPKK